MPLPPSPEPTAWSQLARRLPVGFQVARIAGVPIFVAPSWVASVAVIAVLGVPVVQQAVPGTSTTSAVTIAVLLGVLLGVSVLAHELGHCVAARLVGSRVLGVRLYLLGGASELVGVPRTPRDEAVIAGAGPVVSAAVAGLCAIPAAAVDAGSVQWLLWYLLALANAVLAVFNVLPALPLDGGRVVRAAVWRLSGRRPAGTAVAVAGGFVVAGALAAASVVLLLTADGSALLGAIGLGTAAFVAVGAAGEFPRRIRPVDLPTPGDAALAADMSQLTTTDRPVGTSRSPRPGRVPDDWLSLARPVVTMPAESPMHLAAGAGTSVLLTGTGGMSSGLLDHRVAAELARERPTAPAAAGAEALEPDSVLLAGDAAGDVAGRMGRSRASMFLVVDDDGRASGVLHRADLLLRSARDPR